MTIAYINQTVKEGAAPTGSTATNAWDITGANFLVLQTSSYLTAVSTPTDTAGNTWVGLTERASPSNAARCRLFYCVNPIIASNLVVTVAGGGYTSIAGMAFSGVASSPVNQQVGVGSNGVGGFTFPGSLTPPQDGCLHVTSFTTGGVGGIALATVTGYTTAIINGTTGHCLGLGAKIITPAAAQNPSWTWTGGSADAASAHVVFLPDPGGIPVPSKGGGDYGFGFGFGF